MPRIMVRCPKTRKAIPTGLTSELIKLDTLETELTLTVCCQACGRCHKWKLKDAWVEEPDRKRASSGAFSPR
jgi:hypothetical protein